VNQECGHTKGRCLVLSVGRSSPFRIAGQVRRMRLAFALRDQSRSLTASDHARSLFSAANCLATFKWSARLFSCFRARAGGLRGRAPHWGGPCRTACDRGADECRQRQPPGLLAVVVKLAELFRVKAEFACHSGLVHVRVDGVCGRRSRPEACRSGVRPRDITTIRRSDWDSAPQLLIGPQALEG
jgi:hypothetical protein